MKHLISFSISFIVVLEFSSCVFGGRIVRREAEPEATEAARDDAVTDAVRDDEPTEADEGGGFPPFNYTAPSDSDDTELVDFDLDAATNSPPAPVESTPTTPVDSMGAESEPGDGKSRSMWRTLKTLYGPIAGLTALFFVGVWLGATFV